MNQFRKNAGLADWAFIAIIVGAMTLIGTATPLITKKADTPVEQLAEQIIRMESGQEVDFSAHLKKDDAGKVTVTNAQARTVNPNAIKTIPPTYSK